MIKKTQNQSENSQLASPNSPLTGSKSNQEAAKNSAGYTDDAKFLLAYLNEDEKALSDALKEFPQSNKAKDGNMNLASYYSSKSDFKKAKEIYAQAFSQFGKDDFDLRQGYGLLLISEAYTISKNEKANDKDRLEGVARLG